MLLEGIAAASVACAGAIGLVLWVDTRSELDGFAVWSLTALVLLSAAGVALALRLTALDFTLGSVAAVLLTLAAWAAVVLLTTHPTRTALAEDDPPVG
ncbi:MAG: hypothetical protein AB7V62_02210 [Thermoleophilia bacterium]